MFVNLTPYKCYADAPTISAPIYAMFQLTFAIMVPVVITGLFIYFCWFCFCFVFFCFFFVVDFLNSSKQKQKKTLVIFFLFLGFCGNVAVSHSFGGIAKKIDKKLCLVSLTSCIMNNPVFLPILLFFFSPKHTRCVG